MQLVDHRLDQPRSSVVIPLILLGLGLLLSAALVLVGTSLAIWNFTDPVQRVTVSGFSTVLLMAVVLANLAPFAIAATTLVWTRTRASQSWPRAVRRAAVWTGGACVVSFFLTMLATGGMP